MPRNNRVRREGQHIVLVFDNIEHRLTEPAFIEWMEQALQVLQAIVAAKHKENPS